MEAPAHFDDVGAAGDFLRTVVVRTHAELMPAEMADAFAREIARRSAGPDGTVTVDYVRLNMEARRPAP